MAVISITKENYDAEVLKSEQNVLLDFWAPWCVPCRKMTALMEELDKEETGVKLAKMDIEACPEIAAKLGIISIPALIYFKAGKPVKKVMGVKSKKDVLKLISK